MSEKTGSNTYFGKDGQMKIKFSSDEEIKVGDTIFVPNSKIIDRILDSNIKFLKAD